MHVFRLWTENKVPEENPHPLCIENQNARTEPSKILQWDISANHSTAADIPATVSILGCAHFDDSIDFSPLKMRIECFGKCGKKRIDGCLNCTYLTLWWHKSTKKPALFWDNSRADGPEVGLTWNQIPPVTCNCPIWPNPQTCSICTWSAATGRFDFPNVELLIPAGDLCRGCVGIWRGQHLKIRKG